MWQNIFIQKIEKIQGVDPEQNASQTDRQTDRQAERRKDESD